MRRLYALIGVVEKATLPDQVGARNVGDDARKADADQQVGLEMLGYGEINHRAADRDHDQVAPPQLLEAGLLEQRSEEDNELVVHAQASPENVRCSALLLDRILHA